MHRRFMAALFGAFVAGASASAAPSPYPWLEAYDPEQAVEARVAVPADYERVAAEEGTFARWLRGLPLKKEGTPVKLHNGELKARQDVHAAVVDIDVGRRDLQQCADAVIRLRAEYLFGRGELKAIHFNFTSGDRADYARWKEGDRPVVEGNRVRWERSADADASHAGFRRYLDTVFTYAGSASLSRELEPVRDRSKLGVGDVFIRGGHPGHAVMVVDLAERREGGKRAFLLAQSYMPAQDIHILKNPGDAGLNPWYDADFGEDLETPEWTFRAGELRRFKVE